MKLGLCLTGGGARGAYQIGALQALADLGIYSQVEAYAGTSIGAVNVTLLAGSSLEESKHLWLSLSNEMLKRTENAISSLMKGEIVEGQKGIFEIDSLEELLDNNTNFDKIKKQDVFITLANAGSLNEGLLGVIRSSYEHYVKKETHVSYVNLRSSTDKKSALQKVISSCSIPIAFPVKNLEDKQYVDGGLYDNVPVTPLIEAGCDTIIVIQLHRFSPFESFRFNETSTVKIHEIRSKHLLGGLLNFDKDKAKKLYDYGYEDAMEYFKNNTL